MPAVPRASSPKPPTLLFAPGAGASSDSEWMQSWATRLAAVGTVVPFDYTYRLQGRRPPDRLPKLIARHQEAFAEVRETTDGPIVAVGKSMGSRVGCHLSIEPGGNVAACVCFGYPLVSSSKTKKVRDEVLRQMHVPVLFIQGTRDKMGPLPLLESVMKDMTAPHRLHVVHGGDHSLLVGKRALAAAGMTQDDVDAEILEAISSFLVEHSVTA